MIHFKDTQTAPVTRLVTAALLGSLKHPLLHFVKVRRAIQVLGEFGHTPPHHACIGRVFSGCGESLAYYLSSQYVSLRNCASLCKGI